MSSFMVLRYCLSLAFQPNVLNYFKKKLKKKRYNKNINASKKIEIFDSCWLTTSNGAIMKGPKKYRVIQNLGKTESGSLPGSKTEKVWRKICTKTKQRIWKACHVYFHYGTSPSSLPLRSRLNTSWYQISKCCKRREKISL